MYANAQIPLHTGEHSLAEALVPSCWIICCTCNGSEENLLQCLVNPLGNNDCSHSEDAGVRCSDPSMTLDCTSASLHVHQENPTMSKNMASMSILPFSIPDSCHVTYS